MADLKQVEFFVVRYSPNAVNGEAINLGVVMYEPGLGGFAEVRFTKAWRRVECLDPDVDEEWLRALERDFSRLVKSPQEWLTLFPKLQDSFSNAVQFSPRMICRTEDPAKELERVVKDYLEQPGARVGRVSGRQLILVKMEDALEQAGVMPLLRRSVSLEEYTRKGDPLRPDFAYPLGQEIKFLHAVSLRASVAQGVLWAARFPQIAGQIQAKEKAVARLTVVLDDGLDQARDDVRFALDMMKESGIGVFPVAEMPGLAEQVRRELRV